LSASPWLWREHKRSGHTRALLASQFRALPKREPGSHKGWRFNVLRSRKASLFRDDVARPSRSAQLKTGLALFQAFHEINFLELSWRLLRGVDTLNIHALALCFIVRLIGKPLHAFPDALSRGSPCQDQTTFFLN
jgi:hypothetical protein